MPLAAGVRVSATALAVAAPSVVAVGNAEAAGDPETDREGRDERETDTEPEAGREGGGVRLGALGVSVGKGGVAVGSKALPEEQAEGVAVAHAAALADETSEALNCGESVNPPLPETVGDCEPEGLPEPLAAALRVRRTLVEGSDVADTRAEKGVPGFVGVSSGVAEESNEDEDWPLAVPEPPLGEEVAAIPVPELSREGGCEAVTLALTIEEVVGARTEADAVGEVEPEPTPKEPLGVCEKAVEAVAPTLFEAEVVTPPVPLKAAVGNAEDETMTLALPREGLADPEYTVERDCDTEGEAVTESGAEGELRADASAVTLPPPPVLLEAQDEGEGELDAQIVAARLTVNGAEGEARTVADEGSEAVALLLLQPLALASRPSDAVTEGVGRGDCEAEGEGDSEREGSALGVTSGERERVGCGRVDTEGEEELEIDALVCGVAELHA